MSIKRGPQLKSVCLTNKKKKKVDGLKVCPHRGHDPFCLCPRQDVAGLFCSSCLLCPRTFQSKTLGKYSILTSMDRVFILFFLWVNLNDHIGHKAAKSEGDLLEAYIVGVITFAVTFFRIHNNFFWVCHHLFDIFFLTLLYIFSSKFAIILFKIGIIFFRILFFFQNSLYFFSEFTIIYFWIRNYFFQNMLYYFLNSQ